MYLLNQTNKKQKYKSKHENNILFNHIYIYIYIYIYYRAGRLTKKQMELIETKLQKWFVKDFIDIEGADCLTYALDVLLPEAIVRLYMKHENIGYDEAAHQIRRSTNKESRSYTMNAIEKGYGI